MAEHADRVWSSIDIPKTIAGALAAVCAAVVGSFLGVAGTLVGAAVASIIGSVGTEVYRHSLSKGAKKLQTLTPAFVKAPAAVGTPSVAAATEEDSPSHTVPPGRGNIRWGRVALIAGALFVLAMGSLTVVEFITGRSVASTVGNGTGARSTWSGIFDSGSGNSAPTPAPSPSTPVSTSKTPAVHPTTQPTSVTSTGTTAPTTTTAAPTDDPAQTPPAANNGGQNVNPEQGQSTP